MAAFDITDPIPSPLGPGYESSQALHSNSGFAYNFAVAGHPFLSAIRADDPAQRGFSQVRRQQIDTSKAPGEQSLDNWWLRSQFDWSAGAGQVLFEPSDDAVVRSRFLRSQGVDPWTPGELSLLPEMTALTADAGCPVAAARTSGGVDYLVYSNGVATYKHDGTTATAITGLTGQPSWLWSMGRKILSCHSTGIDVIDVSGTTGASTWTGAGSAPKAWWVKQRIIAAVGASLHELSASGSGALPAALYTHPDSAWSWSAVVETPSSILAAGYAGTKGAIYRFDVSNTGTLPALTSAITTAEFPQGEWPTGMISYLGSFVTIGTNKGVRVAVVADGGQLTYGPLTIETSGPVEHFTAKDSYVFAGVEAGQADGMSGLHRIDLGAPDGTGRYAWAADVACGDAGSITGVTHFDGRLVVASDSLWIRHATNLVSAGWVDTAATLFGTLELKQFHSLRLVASVPGGTVAASTVVGGVEVPLMVFDSDPAQEVAVSPRTPVDRLTLRFTLARDGGDSTSGPTLTGWQVRAIPVISRKEIVQVPLLCYDTERDAAGNVRYGSAWGRYSACRDDIADAGTVTFQNLDTGEAVTGVVEDWGFKQFAPPQGFDGFGGIVTLAVRVL